MAVPFVHAPYLKPGAAEQLSERIIRLIAPNPGPFTYTGSGAYLLVGDGETVVIDPGPDDEGHIALLAEAAPSAIKRILITHTHRDHCGGADRLKALTGAETYGYGAHPTSDDDLPPALDEGADLGFVPDHLLRDGEVLSVPGLTIEAVHTPGHIGNHLCFALQEEAALFTGDHIMGWATTVVAPPDGDMTAYMESLEKLLIRIDQIYYPTHGAPITAPHTFVRAVREHREGRDHAILSTLNDGPREVMQIVDEVYVGLAAPLKIAAALNVRAHLEAHIRLGLVTLTDNQYALKGEA
ncbi:MAG: MBL fold metallo-hydrolase [Pseudomonadota bacterium]